MDVMSAGVPVSEHRGGARPGPAVMFGDARRPETATIVQLPPFDGPLGLLLALIEAQQLDVLAVPLGALAEAYLDALATLDSDRLGNVSAFVAIASQLILIKSRAMLPRHETPAPSGLPDEGPDPEAELRARLIIYRAYRDVGAMLQLVAKARIGLFRRDGSAAQASALAGAGPTDAPPLDPAVLVAALGRLVRLAPPLVPAPELVPRSVTIGQRATVIRAALREAIERGASGIVLQELLRGVRDRVVVALTFLAMLELMKRREIVVEQTEPWGPIHARRMTDDERAAAGLAPLSDAEMDTDVRIDGELDSFR